jgi:A/G-specific adenine glycosylase
MKSKKLYDTGQIIMDKASHSDDITNRLLRWYEEHKRDLPWRNTRDPYKIWLSEIILQQTRVDQGLPYYYRFIAKYPTIQLLAEAPVDEVLRLWQGLGYYSRARNLHKCAKLIVVQYNGQFPSQRQELLKLPGIGAYTSAAIASFAFGAQEAVVDGNVIRVAARIFGIEEDASKQKTVRVIQDAVKDIISAGQPDIFNHAIMDFGAIQCVPANPTCEVCVFADVCIARQKGWQNRLPVKTRVIKKKKRFFHYLIMNYGGKVLMNKRLKKDIWNGLYQFYLIEAEEPVDFAQLQLPVPMLKNPAGWSLAAESKPYRHQLTHQSLTCRFYHIKVQDVRVIESAEWPEHQLYSMSEIDDLPKPILLEKYLSDKLI